MNQEYSELQLIPQGFDQDGYGYIVVLKNSVVHNWCELDCWGVFPYKSDAQKFIELECEDMDLDSKDFMIRPIRSFK